MTKKNKTNNFITEIYIGKNGTGKTNHLKEISKKKGKVEKNIIFEYNSNTLPEEVNYNMTDAAFNKSYWKDFAIFLEKATVTKITLKLKELYKFDEYENSETNKEIEKIIKKAKKIGDLTLNFENDESVKMIATDKLKELNITASPKTINEAKENLIFTLKIDIWNISKELKDFINKSNFESGRGTGNYQYLTIKFLHEFVKNGNILNKNIHVFIDEPEIYLHPSLERKVAYMLRTISQYVNLYVVTHSPTISSFLISENSNLYLFYLNDKHESKNKKINLSNAAKKNSISIREKMIKNLLSDKLILVEGDNDVEFLDILIDEIRCDMINDNEEINENYIIQISGLGKESHPKYVKSLIDNYGYINENIFLIYDIDTKKMNDKLEDKNRHYKWNADIDELIEKGHILESNVYSFQEDIESSFNLNKKTWGNYSLNGELKNKLKNNPIFNEIKIIIKDFINSK